MILINGKKPKRLLGNISFLIRARHLVVPNFPISANRSIQLKGLCLLSFSYKRLSDHICI